MPTPQPDSNPPVPDLTVGSHEQGQQQQSPSQSFDDGKGRKFPCPTCGADLTFDIPSQSLRCTHCGVVQKIELNPGLAIREQDFQTRLADLRAQKDETLSLVESNEVRCEACGANVVFEGALTSTSCPYCGSLLQRDKIHRGGFRIPVDAVLPFQVRQDRAKDHYWNWVRTRWFAPNDFKHAGESDKLKGVYLPYWTFDSFTMTQYSGERGERYSVTVGSGKNKRTEWRTRWYPAAGRFDRTFDDVLVLAATGLPSGYLDRLAPWPLQKGVPFTAEFLAGFFSRTYDVDMDHGFELARANMELQLRENCLHKIGGDEQRLHKMNCQFENITYKHILLPVWMVAYRYRDRSYQIFINAMTGQVQGERPYSWVKISFAVAAAALAFLILILATKN